MHAGPASVTVNISGQWADLPNAVDVFMAPEPMEPYFQNPEQYWVDRRAQLNSTSPSPSVDQYTASFPGGTACPDPSDAALVELFTALNATALRRPAQKSRSPHPFPHDRPFDFSDPNSSAMILNALHSRAPEYSAYESTRKAHTQRAQALVFLERRTELDVSTKLAATESLAAAHRNMRAHILGGNSNNQSNLSSCKLVPVTSNVSMGVMQVDRFVWACDGECKSLFRAASKKGVVLQSDISARCAAVMQALAWTVACQQQRRLVHANCGSRSAATASACAALQQLVDLKCDNSPHTNRTSHTPPANASWHRVALPARKFLDIADSIPGVFVWDPRAADRTLFRFSAQPYAVHVDRADGAAAGRPLPSSRSQADGDVALDAFLYEWVPYDSACKVGKPPLPRRDFSMTPVAANGFMLGINTTHPGGERGAPTNAHWFRPFGGSTAFVVFGGRGINSGIRTSEYLNQTENSATRPTEHDINYWASSKPLPAVDFNDTYLLLDLFNVSKEEKAHIGVDGDTCPGTATVRGEALIPPGIVGSESIRKRQVSLRNVMNGPEGYPVDE